MKVSELITELQRWPADATVHLDIQSSDENGWEGDRVVRTVSGLRHQSGFNAVAIDADSIGDSSDLGEQTDDILVPIDR